MKTPTIHSGKTRAVIFDVDGTLYNQKILRKLIIKKLMNYYLIRPHRLSDLKIIHHFRNERENNHSKQVYNLAEEQYLWAAESAGVPVSKVKEVIDQWIFKKPLQLLPGCIYDGVRELFNNLADQGIARIIFSDYPAQEKLKALGLSAEGFICATDPNINRLKPHPRGLEVIMKRWSLTPEQLLFIGDRDDRDGECARRAGVPYLLKLDKKIDNTPCFTSFRSLTEWNEK